MRMMLILIASLSLLVVLSSIGGLVAFLINLERVTDFWNVLLASALQFVSAAVVFSYSVKLMATKSYGRSDFLLLWSLIVINVIDAIDAVLRYQDPAYALTVVLLRIVPLALIIVFCLRSGIARQSLETGYRDRHET